MEITNNEEYIKEMENLVEYSFEVVQEQEKLINTLRKAIKSSEQGRQYWINNYFYLEEQIMEEEKRLGVEINYRRLKLWI